MWTNPKFGILIYQVALTNDAPTTDVKKMCIEKRKDIISISISAPFEVI